MEATGRIFGILLFLNGYTLFLGGPELKHDRAEALEKAGVHISLNASRSDAFAAGLWPALLAGD